MPNKIKKIFFAASLILLAAGCNNQAAQTTQTAPVNNNQSQPTATGTIPTGIAVDIAIPINNALARTTKKFFGTYVTPQHSPVQPEKFTGYHTGLDFETFTNEQNSDVPIFALCGGKLILKKYASGYGGVAVESCSIKGQTVTVIYGHLRLSSIAQNIGDNLSPAEQIGVLGTGFSQETDGERKHLHLGIHKGNTINILGYVQNQTDLIGWIDPMTILK